MNSTFVMEKKVGTEWVTLPAEIAGGDSKGTYVPIMKRFSGMVFDYLRPGLYRMLPNEFHLPNGDIATFGMEFTNFRDILPPTRLCIGFIMLGDEPILSDSEYKINTNIYSGNNLVTNFNCSFSIKNGVVANYKAICSGSSSFNTQNIIFESKSKCIPVIFAIEDSEEFNNSHGEEYLYRKYLSDNSIPAKWVKPIAYMYSIINFIVDEKGLSEFNMPEAYTVEIGSDISLPDYTSLFKNLLPLGWRIENVEYPLGGLYTVPNHNITAELIYEAKKYSGITI